MTDFPEQYSRVVRYGRVNHEDLAAMLNGVHSHGPQHSLPSLVLADWFDDHELPAHAEFVRKSIEASDTYRADERLSYPDYPYHYSYDDMVPGGGEINGVISQVMPHDDGFGHSLRLFFNNGKKGKATMLGFVPHHTFNDPALYKAASAEAKRINEGK